MKKTANEKAKDYYYAVVLTQLLLSSVILAIMFFLSGVKAEFKNDFKSFLKWDISENLYTVVSSVKSYFYSGEAWSVNSGSVTYKQNDTTLSNTTSFENMGGEEISIYEAADNASFAPLMCTTKLLCPIKEPRFTSYFGYRISPITFKWAFHTGLDIAAPQDTIIRAALNGTVTKTGQDSVAGKYIFLTHSDGFVTFYCHCSEILAPLGANIRQGETIAKVGSTGNSTGPHLHFEVRKDNIRYNPLPLLNYDC